jgi:hypothetical protein
VSSDITNIYSAEGPPKRPATTGISDSDSKFVRRNQSLAKELVSNEPEEGIKSLKHQDRKTPDKFRSANDSDTDRGRHSRGAKSELEKIKEQLNIHYGQNSQVHGNRLGSRSGKSLPEMASAFYNQTERKPLNQLISAEDGLPLKETVAKVHRRAPVRPTYKADFLNNDSAQATKADIGKKHMFSISNLGAGSRPSRGRQVQSADKQVEEKKTGPAIHSTIRSIISTLDHRQLGVSGTLQAKKTKSRPSKII